MGTNYYLIEDSCPTCGRSDETLHIGKSSGGWCFGLHVTDEIESLDDWIKRWSREGAKIVNEYGDEIEPDEMLSVITDRGGMGGRPLLRHEVDGQHCIGNGAGPYDLIVGFFA